MLFTIATSYALRALAALPEDGSFRLSQELAQHLDIPGPYLAKILQTLARHGLLNSIRGPRGGFRLGRPSHRISVADVVGVLDGMASTSGCLLGFRECGHDPVCPMHAAWTEVKNHLDRTMALVTIRDLQLLEPGDHGNSPWLKNTDWLQPGRSVENSALA
jgi:Rrf2 family protein